MGAPLSREQQDWLKGLGKLVGAAPVAQADEKKKATALRADLNADKQALFGGLIPGIPDIIPDAVRSRITIKNESGSALRLVKAKVETRPADFKPAPPTQIPANTSRDFSVSNALVGSIPAPVGTGGEVTYEVEGDAKKTQLFMKWERGFVLPSRDTPTKITPADSAFNVSGQNPGGDDFSFIVSGPAGPSPVPVPPPPTPVPAPVPTPVPTPVPGAAANLASSCLITVVNETGQTLTRADAMHDRGDFMMPPPRTVAPGQVINFVSVETPGAIEQGCKGFVMWEVGTPMLATWRIEWDNPEGAKNSALGTLTPQTAGFRSQDVIGQGEENVPVSFTISGGAPAPGPVPPPGPTPPPGPVPPPVPVPPPGPTPPPPEPEYKPPPESKQPTLRKGDKSEDGWVEYAQTLLNMKGAKLAEDGDFGPAMLAAVNKFQQQKKLLVDGVIGNQTWAALRDGAPEKPSTDGREPHTYVEQGVEARWVVESELNNRYTKDSDQLEMAVESVGDTPLDPSTQATVRITPPGAKAKVVTIKIGPHKSSPKTVGFTHIITFENFRKNFPSTPVDAPVTEYLIEAYLPKELGGDNYAQKICEA